MNNILCAKHKDRTEPLRLCHTCQRMAVEHDIAERTIKAIFAAGLEVQIANGEDESPRYSYDFNLGLQPSVNRVLDAMFQTDEDDVFVFVKGEGSSRRRWIRFVYGNDGWDVISDYTTSLEDILRSVTIYADTLCP